MINEKSLQNLRLPKTRKIGYGYQYSLPQEKVDELFSYFAEGISLEKAAKLAKVCSATAKKYFDKGDEKRGIKPLKYRLAVFQDKISQKFNILIEERRMKLLATIRETITNLEKRTKEAVCPACQGAKIQIGKDNIKLLCPACKGEGMLNSMMDKSSLKDLDRLVRLEIFLLGGVTQKERETKMLSAEEISGGDS